MSGFIISALVVLIFIVIYQVAKASEYATVISGEAKMRPKINKLVAWLMFLFFFIFMAGIWYCHNLLKDKLLPVSASTQGIQYDSMLYVTVIITGIVFVITQFLLFWFAYKYSATEKSTSFFFPHNNKLEVLWTTVPAIAMAALVAIGLKNWYNFTDEAPSNAMVIEVVGKQFNWLVRYPGKDNELGKRDFRKINDANNVLGLDWSDPHNMDDVISQNGELHCVAGRPVKLVIGSRDVIHDVGLPHFRMKVDAVPGITTTMWFTPYITTDSMKKITNNPDFVYEISCDQMCGKGHYSMQGHVIVQTQAEYDKWMASQQSYYASVAPAKPAADTTAKAEKTESKPISMKN